MAKKHRQYDNDYPSVTEVLSVLRKVGLEQWFLSNTRAYCTEKSNKGKLIGTQIHQAIQSYIETGKASVETEYDQEVTTALKSFMIFRKEHPELKLKRAEIPLTSNHHKFNGTIDCIADNVLVDWKTGEAKTEDKPKIYDEWKYQVSSYFHLYNLSSPETYTTKAIIVAIGKDKVSYNITEMDEDELYDCFHKVFLPCLSIYNYQKKRSK